MRHNADRCLALILKHEGGYVNHPDDPGGATNMGVTIGTLRSLGMDLDGDGDVDVADLRKLTPADARAIFKRFYWDKVEGDALPDGVDYTVADFAVNSGPSRAAKHLQNAVDAKADGVIGPKTLAAVAIRDPRDIINAIHASRLRFLRNLKTWATFGRGWKRRVDEVLDVSLDLAASMPAEPPERPSVPRGGLLYAICKAFGGCR